MKGFTVDATRFFYLYVILYRVGILVAGIICMILGYRLFIKGISYERSNDATELKAKSDKFAITLKSTAPGIFFALFGSAIISVMILKGGPEWSNTSENGAIVHVRSVDAKTPPELVASISALNDMGIAFEQKGDNVQAEECYLKAIARAAIPINNLAWLYQKMGNTEQAFHLAEVAILSDSENPKILHTLSVILCKKGETERAVSLIEKAAGIDAHNFQKTFELMKKRRGCE